MVRWHCFILRERGEWGKEVQNMEWRQHAADPCALTAEQHAARSTQHAAATAQAHTQVPQGMCALVAVDVHRMQHGSGVDKRDVNNRAQWHLLHISQFTEGLIDGRADEWLLCGELIRHPVQAPAIDTSLIGALHLATPLTRHNLCRGDIANRRQ